MQVRFKISEPNRDGFFGNTQLQGRFTFYVIYKEPARLVRLRHNQNPTISTVYENAYTRAAFSDSSLLLCCGRKPHHISGATVFSGESEPTLRSVAPIKFCPYESHYHPLLCVPGTGSLGVA